MSIIIEKAKEAELPEVEKLYNDICDYLADKEYNPGWRKGCFPTADDALMFLQGENLYIFLRFIPIITAKESERQCLILPNSWEHSRA